ncbi:MAG: WD40 repeat domain-containing protein [Alphaproteobacteria bacterium]|nr:WD40 repeat domain-containing protein [Alphaproteobacteria bacterium]
MSPLLLLIAAVQADPGWSARLPAYSYSTPLAWEADRVAVGTDDGEVLVFDAQGRPVSRWSVHRLGVAELSLSEDGDRLLTVDWKGKVTVWDTDTGKKLVRWKPDGRWSWPSATLSPDGRVALYTGGDAAELRPVDGGPKRTLWDTSPSDTDTMGFVGDKVYAPADWSTLGTWDVASGAPGRAVPLQGSSYAIREGGGLLYNMDHDGRVQRIDPATGQSERLDLTGLSDLPLAVSPDGGRLSFGTLAVDGVGASVATWDVAEERHLAMGPSFPDGLAALVYSPDGGRLAAVSGTELRIFDAPSGEEAPAPPHGAEVRALGFSGEQAVAVYLNGEVWTWHLEGGAVAIHAQLPMSTGGWGGQEVALRPDGQELAMVTRAGSLVRWDLATNTEIEVLMAEVEDYLQVFYGFDGSLAAVGSDWIVTWDPEGEMVGKIPIYDADLVAVGAGGQRIATSGYNGNLALHEIAEDKVAWTARVDGGLVDLRFLPSGALLGTDWSGTLRFFDGETGQPDLTRFKDALLMDSMEEAEAATTDPTGAWHLASGDAGDLALRSLPDGELASVVFHQWPWDFGQSYARVAMHPDGQRALTANPRGVVQLWDLSEETGRLTRTFDAPQPGAFAVTGGGGQLAAGLSEGRLMVWDAAGALREVTLEGEPLDLAISPDGRHLVVALAERIELYGLDDLALRWSAEPFGYIARTVRFDAGGAVVWVQADDGTLARLDVATGESLYVDLPIWPSGFTRLDDGRFVVLSDYDGLAVQKADGGWKTRRVPRRKRWDLSGEVVSCGDRVILGTFSFWGAGAPAFYSTRDGIKGRLGAAETEGLSPERLACQGDRVAAAQSGGQVRILDFPEGRTLRELPGDGTAIADLAFLPGGRLATASLSGFVRIWDVETGALISEHAHRDEIIPPPPPPPGAAWGEALELGGEGGLLEQLFLEGEGAPLEAPPSEE